MAKSSTANPTLPTDVMYEILSRTSFETLRICRQVSEELKQITYDPSFKQLFFERTKLLKNFFSGFVIESMKNSSDREYISMTSQLNYNQLDFDMSLSFLPISSAKIIAATKSGILLCATSYVGNPQCYVCKPTTKQWEKIPYPKTESRYIPMFGMMELRSRPLRYKIVRISIPHNTAINKKSVVFEVFDSETWEWKQLNIGMKRIIGPFLGRRLIFSYEEVMLGGYKPTLSVCGNFYWPLLKNEILEFNLEKESWEILKLPPPLRGRKMNLVEYGGRLAFISKVEREECMELWVKDNCRENKWSRTQKVCMKVLMKKEGLADNYFQSQQFYDYDFVWLVDGSLKLMLFKFQDSSFDVVEFGEENKPLSKIFFLEPDSEPVNLKSNATKSKQIG